MSKEIINTWLIGDLHAGHHNLVKLCGRPENFTEIIEDNWKKLVKPEDLVIVLGDVSFNGDLMVDRLPGRSILVKGNHDGKSYNYYMSHGFLFACEEFSMNIGGLRIIFSHKPLLFHEYDVNIHAHLHNMCTINSVCFHYLVSLEKNGYRPELLGDILPVLKKEVDVRREVESQ